MGFPSYLEDIEELRNRLEVDSEEIDSIKFSNSLSPEGIQRLSDLVEKKRSDCSKSIQLAIKAFGQISQLQQIPEIEYFSQIRELSSEAARLRNENTALHKEIKELSRNDSNHRKIIKKLRRTIEKNIEKLELYRSKPNELARRVEILEKRVRYLEKKQDSTSS